MYEVATGVMEGQWHTYKTCRHCIAVRAWLVQVCSGFCYGGVADDLWEHRNEGYNPRWLSVAVAGMNRQWRDKDGRLWRADEASQATPGGSVRR